MKTITINITHDEVFEDIVEQLKNKNPKHINFKINNSNDDLTVNITGTLEELNND